MRYCNRCQNVLNDDEHFCWKCGAAVDKYQQGRMPPESRTGTYMQSQPHYAPPIGTTQDYPQNYGQQNANQEQGYLQQEYKRQNSAQQKKEGKILAFLAIFFATLGGILGIVFSVIGLAVYKEKKNRQKCLIAIVESCIWLLLIIIFYMI